METCLECSKILKNTAELSKHINRYHSGTLTYFNKYLKKETDGKCIVCGSPTKFINIRGYKKTCSKKCSNIYCFDNIKLGYFKKYGVTINSPFDIKEIRELAKQTCIKRYNVDTPFKSSEIRKKRDKTIKERYGVNNVFQSEKIKYKSKKTKKEKYGNEKYINSEKAKQTNNTKYGGNSPMCDINVRNKSIETNLKKYGVENPAQNESIHEKMQLSRLTVKKFKKTDLYYQGSYELDFLEKYYDKFKDIQRGPSIKYLFNGKNKIHYPDFFIPELNLIIECKNSYAAKRYKDIIECKKNAAITKGFKYIIIIDKNYLNFNKEF